MKDVDGDDYGDDNPPAGVAAGTDCDLSHARVFFSVLDPEDAADCLTALNGASGFLQREIGKTLKSRLTPKLSFIYDDTDIRGRQLSDLIDSALASDRDKSGQ